MIIKLLCAPIWILVEMLFSFLPDPTLDTIVSSSFFDLLSKGIAVIGYSNFITMMGSVMFWYCVQLTWAIVEWVYKKIPGVN